MRWSLDFPIQESPFPISHSQKILSMGSCFAQTIGQKMKESKFDILINPFGTIFHPLNLADLLDQAIFGYPVDEQKILEFDGRFMHYSAHSDLRASSQDELKNLYNSKIQEIKTFLQEGSHLILTFGTSWIYQHQDLGRVANCHKQSNSLFTKELSELEEMELVMTHLLETISNSFPQLKITLTLSPVRHTKDGIPENQLSKSQLRVLCSRLKNRFEQVNYFPAYEIMMDELRDYRFYKSDLIHPTEEAENYIWEKWKKSVFTVSTQEKVREIEKIQLELAHRPFNPESDSHQKFLQNLLKKLEGMHGELDFSKEIKSVSELLNPPRPL